MKQIFLTLHLIIVVGCLNSFANTYTVTKTVDDGSTGTLRWAITQANSNSGYDVINFGILTGVNTFESSGLNSWAVITIGSALPIITETVLIDGTTQTDTNTGFVAGKTVGVDGIVQGNINYPDVYIVCNYALPNAENSLIGNGLFIDAPNVSIKGLAISGFGNTNTTQATAVGHADISIRYSATSRIMNTLVSDCFLSCDPRGVMPTPASRASKSGSILILGNNHSGKIERNYIAHPGGYGIVFHGTVDNTSSTPNLTKSRYWTVQENQLYNIGTSTTYTGGRAADAISMLCVNSSLVKNNYIENWEQFAIDLGHNTDSNRVENNNITGFTKTTGSAPCGGVRTAFSSQRDSVIKNDIYNNTSTSHLAGIWADESRTTFTGGVQNNDSLFYYAQNKIHDNINSGIVLSSNGVGTVTGVAISLNSIYNNTGLGIDLNFVNLTGSPLVTVNDDGDGDVGTNNLQNFPFIDSAKINSSSVLVWGKGPAGSTMEFFARDGQWNQHVGLGLNYGEGKTFIGSGVEGSAGDLVTGTGSYNVDGNVATNNAAMFYFVLPYSGFFNTDSLTATATVNGSTSEFGPRNFVQAVLDCILFKFTGVNTGEKTILSWEALCDKNFSFFLVEHSADGISFSSLSKIHSGETGNVKRSFEHFVNPTDRNFYRLKMVSRNNSYKYSQIISINGSGLKNSRVKVLQNPFHKELRVAIDARESSDVHMFIVNASGATVASENFQVTKGKNTVVFNNLFDFPAGPYQLVVRMHNSNFSFPIIKQ